MVCFVTCGSSFFLLCSLLSLIVVHYAREFSCREHNVQCSAAVLYFYTSMYEQYPNDFN